MQLAPPRPAVARARDDDQLLVSWRTLAPTLALAAAATMAVAIFALGLGTARIAPATTIAVLLDHLPFVSIGGFTRTEDAIIWQVRMPRVVLAGLVGATLGISGAAYQAVFRNPLAEPYIMGVAAGASVGATLIIVSPLFVTSGVLSPLPLAAFAGAVLAVMLAYGLARVGRSFTTTSLILSGVAISSLGTSIVTYLMLTFSERTIAVLNWVLGGFNTAKWLDAGILLPYSLLAAALLLPYARILNVLQLDEDQARQLGVNVERVKITVLAVASLATAAAVAVSGLIGFVGLIVPHTVRLIWGPDYRRLLPLSGFFGASFLILADLIARTVDPGHEIPIGVVTAIVGAPFFLFLLRRYSTPMLERA
jgi:iron complex transport system permease protein